MADTIKRLFAVLFLAIVAANEAAAAGGGATFGDKPSFQSGAQLDYGLSPDKQALTIAFGDFEVGLETGKAPEKATKQASSPATNAPIATRVASIVIPVTGKSICTSFYLQGYISTSEGAQGTLIVNINGQTTVTRFRPKSDRSFLEKVSFKASPASEIRMTLFLLLERDSRYQSASAYLNVATIDTDAALAKQKSASKGAK